MGVLIPLSARRIPHRYVCIECGESFLVRMDLDKHWMKKHHGPSQVQVDAMARARASIGDEVAWRDDDD